MQHNYCPGAKDGTCPYLHDITPADVRAAANKIGNPDPKAPPPKAPSKRISSTKYFHQAIAQMFLTTHFQAQMR